MNGRQARLALVSIAASAVLLAPSAHALEVVDGSKLPASYGTEVEVKDKDGKPAKQLVFSGMVGMRPAAVFHQILAAYGLRVVDGSKLPASYGTEVEVKDKDGKLVKELVFNGMVGTQPASELHRILTAYGARVVDGSKLPASYGTEVEVKDKDGKPAKQLVFTGTVGTRPAAELHQILSAYGK
jgi:hypothetical protein